MKFHSCKFLAPVVATALMLSACGGGDEGVFVDQDDPTASGLSASVAVTASGNAALNGTYSSSNIFLNNVVKVNPIGGDPETCRVDFSGLVQQGSTRTMDGNIRYLPGTDQLRSSFISIDTIEYRLEGSTGGRVDKAGNRIVYTGAVFSSTQGTGLSLTLTGAIPLRGNRPEGC
jgi:hypothetical protein